MTFYWALVAPQKLAVPNAPGTGTAATKKSNANRYKEEKRDAKQAEDGEGSDPSGEAICKSNSSVTTEDLLDCMPLQNRVGKTAVGEERKVLGLMKPMPPGPTQ